MAMPGNTAMVTDGSAVVVEKMQFSFKMVI